MIIKIIKIPDILIFDQIPKDTLSKIIGLKIQTSTMNERQESLFVHTNMQSMSRKKGTKNLNYVSYNILPVNLFNAAKEKNEELYEALLQKIGIGRAAKSKCLVLHHSEVECI